MSLLFIRYFIDLRNGIGSVAAGLKSRANVGVATIVSRPLAKTYCRSNARVGASSSKPSISSPGFNMPDFKAEIRARLADLQLSPVREAEIVEELSQHLEETYDRVLSLGASEKEA